jgi:hypothetical protein
MNACLPIGWSLVIAGLTCIEAPRLLAGDRVPASGLVKVALKASEFDAQTRRVALLLDPTVSPSIYCPSTNGLPQRPKGELPDPDPVGPFKRELEQAGAEAAIYLDYSGGLGFPYFHVMKILRFVSEKEAEARWLARQKEGESKLITVAGEQVLFTAAGRLIRTGVKASLNTIECKAGRYLIRVAPASAVLEDAGTTGALRQMEKIAKLREPQQRTRASFPALLQVKLQRRLAPAADADR